MWLVDGLPLHPLVVHLPVVLIPAVAAGMAAYVVRPRWRRPLGIVLAAMAVVCAGAAIVAVWSGEQLGGALRRGDELRSHQALGERTRAYAVVLAIATVALVAFERVRGRHLASRVTAGGAAVAVVALGATIAVAMAGHSGARLAWEEEVAVARGGDRGAPVTARGMGEVASGGSGASGAAPVAPADEPFVDVVLGEWALMSSTDQAPPGTVTFRFRNRGAVPHALRIRSAGSGKNRLEWRSNVVQPGEEGVLTVDLPAGTFELDCPIEDGHGEHDALGMETTFTVRAGAPPVTAPATPATDAARAGTGEATVEISGFEFLPRDLRVARGTVVRWVNADAAPHTATGDGWDTGRLARGGSADVTFDRAGTFSYICDIHPAMAGTVTVT
ncbi:MAG TPA: DUF2231 domain-containing protein [Acidimicrobiales bacterium]|jgi:plastocyanin/uncharacterized membrane protein|nr:DUF2231 domain-containing protein [Acidimicrobiales bacterium]